MSVYDDLIDHLDEPDEETVDAVIEDPVDNADTESSQNHDKKTLARIEELTKRLNDIKDEPVAKANNMDRNTEKYDLNKENNLLDPDVRAVYLEDIYVATPEDILSSPIPTTTTLSGILKNVNIDERLVCDFEPNHSVVMIKSNFGVKIHESYLPFIAAGEKKSTRGRKPKKKDQKKERKKQGSGECFNSQITFVVLTDKPDSKNASGYKEYKFKVFRNNKMQLPGGQPNCLDDIICANYEVLDILNETLHKGETDPAKMVKLTTLSPQMKNYKFFLKLNPGWMLDLYMLNKIFLMEQLKDKVVKNGKGVIKWHCTCEELRCNDCFYRKLSQEDEIVKIINIEDYFEDENDYDEVPLHPELFDIIYTLEDTKLAVRFSSPILGNPKKKIRVNIFPGSEIDEGYADGIQPGTWGGKINILGGFYEDITRQIYLYLMYFFDKYYDYVVFHKNAPSEIMYVIEDEDELPENIHQDLSIDEMWQRARNMFNVKLKIPELTDEDWKLASAELNAWHSYYITCCNT